MTGIPSNEPKRGPQGILEAAVDYTRNVLAKIGLRAVLTVGMATPLVACQTPPTDDKAEDGNPEEEGPMEEETTDGTESGMETTEDTVEEGNPMDMLDGDTTTDDSGDTTMDGETGTDTTDGGTDTEEPLIPSVIPGSMKMPSCSENNDQFGKYFDCNGGLPHEFTLEISNAVACQVKIDSVKDIEGNQEIFKTETLYCEDMGGVGGEIRQFKGTFVPILDSSEYWNYFTIISQSELGGPETEDNTTIDRVHSN